MSDLGKVYLVGAGPGATDLITVRGLRILQSSDVILHDSLIAPELLLEASAHSQLISVGKRGYCIGSTKQETINDAMIRLAFEGMTVCRLKCGDPCMFGRGGEEAEALADAGIPFEFVPGVTSALGAAATSFIPLTHRDVGQAVTFVTGHHDPDSPECTLEWSALAQMPVIVFYMAVRHLGRITEKLIECGMSGTTSAAIIENGTYENQRVTVGELALIPSIVESLNIQAPAILVIGEVVRYRESLLQIAHTSLRNSA